jgi:hypothetical protein
MTSEDRRQKTDDGRQKSEDRWQMTEDRCQRELKAEVGMRKAEIWGYGQKELKAASGP